MNSTPSKDIALTTDDKGQMIAHRANCAEIRTLADKQVMTMNDCSRPLPRDIKRHACLSD